MPAAPAPQLTITLDDPETIALLHGYRAFIASEDGIDDCSIEDAATGLIAGCLDGHQRFEVWLKQNPESVSNNLVKLDDVRQVRARPAAIAQVDAETPRRARRAG